MDFNLKDITEYYVNGEYEYLKSKNLLSIVNNCDYCKKII